jgi:hypothetical protein
MVLVADNHRGPLGGVLTWGYGASLEDAKAAFRTSLDGYKAWRNSESGAD